MDGSVSSNDDKPFVCSVSGCKQRFVTEDKLSLHQRKHEFAIDGLTAALFTDETPTPTTFLRDCETMGLFHDLTVKNPFDESFRKAVVGGESETDLPDVLDTPTIMGLFPDSAAALTGILNTPTGTSSIRDMPCRLLSRLRSTLATPSADLRSLPMLFPTSDSPDSGSKPQTPPLSPTTILPTDSPSQSSSSPSSVSPTIITTSATTNISPVAAAQTNSTTSSISGSDDLSISSSQVSPTLNYTVSKSSDTGQTTVTACLVTSPVTSPTVPQNKTVTSPQQHISVPALSSPVVLPIATTQPTMRNSNSKLSSLLKTQAVATTSLLLSTINPVLTSRNAKSSTNTTTTKMALHSIQPAKTTTAIASNNVVNNTAPMIQCQLPTGAVAFLVPAVPTGIFTQNITTAVRDQPELADGNTIVSLTNPVLGTTNTLSQSADSMTSVAPDVAVVSSTASESPAHNIVKQRLKVTLAAKNSSDPNTDVRNQANLTLNENLYNGGQIVTEERRSVKRPYDSQLDEYGSPVSQYSQGEALPELTMPLVPVNEADESRQKILERNRDAARRCRKKKKVFLESLEQRLKEVNQLNAQLMSENTALKLEITQLKSLLIQHKSCDVTRNLSLSKSASGAIITAIDPVVGETADIQVVSPNPDSM